MVDLASLGLARREGKQLAPQEQCIEIRLESTGAFVAWFRSVRRTSSKETQEEAFSTSCQFIDRQELTQEQRAAVKEWLLEQTQMFF